MAKKGNLNILYLAGMAATAVGCVLPMFKIMIKKMNIFDFIGFGSASEIGALLCFAAAIAGILVNFVPVGSSEKLVKIILLAATIIGGLMLFGVDSKLGFKILMKVAYIGLYVIVAGWVVALVGALKKIILLKYS